MTRHDVRALLPQAFSFLPVTYTKRFIVLEPTDHIFPPCRIFSSAKWALNSFIWCYMYKVHHKATDLRGADNSQSTFITKTYFLLSVVEKAEEQLLGVDSFVIYQIFIEKCGPRGQKESSWCVISPLFLNVANRSWSLRELLVVERNLTAICTTV